MIKHFPSDSSRIMIFFPWNAKQNTKKPPFKTKSRIVWVNLTLMIKSVLTYFRFSPSTSSKCWISSKFPGMYEKNIMCVCVCVCVYLCIYIHTYPCISTYVQVNIFYTYIQIYIYIYIASQIVTLGKRWLAWKLGKNSAKCMSRILGGSGLGC